MSRFELLNHVSNMLQDSSTITLANFLVDNEGKRCIVVLDVRFSYCMEIVLTASLYRTSKSPKMKRPSGPY
jgi:hypothetical protein